MFSYRSKSSGFFFLINVKSFLQTNQQSINKAIVLTFFLTSVTYFSANRNQLQHFFSVKKSVQSKQLDFFVFLDSCVGGSQETSVVADTEPGRRDCDSPLVKCECLGRDESRFTFGAAARELKEARNDGEAQQW